MTVDAPLLDAAAGARACAVWSRGLGLASVCAAPDGCGSATLPAAPVLSVEPGSSARALAEHARSTDPAVAGVGLAALNSLLETRDLPLEPGSAQQLLASFASRCRICLVGHFPFVEELRRHARHLSVLELIPREGDLPAAAADDEIPAADLVAITGSALVNGTLDELLRRAAGKRVMLLGPSVPLHPLLFERGIWALCGAVGDDPAAVLAGVRAGRSFRHCGGLRHVILTRDAIASPRR